MTTANDPISTELVHEARKAIKRMRALARLLRHQLGEPELERVDRSLRAAGRRLAGARDAEVRLATLLSLSERHPTTLALDGIERLRARLERERSDAHEPADARAVLADVAAMRNHLARWSLAEHNFDALAPGLRRIYRDGRRHHARVLSGRGRNAADLHTWRKHVKRLYYALDTLGGANAGGARAVTRRAERLGEALGEEHDLWLLATYVRTHPTACGDPNSDAHKTLLRLTERRRKRLRERALAAGARLYEPSPSDFIQRIGNALTR